MLWNYSLFRQEPPELSAHIFDLSCRNLNGVYFKEQYYDIVMLENQSSTSSTKERTTKILKSTTKANLTHQNHLVISHACRNIYHPHMASGVGTSNGDHFSWLSVCTMHIYAQQTSVTFTWIARSPPPKTTQKSIHKLTWLVVLTILKNMKVNGKDYPIYYGK